MRVAKNVACDTFEPATSFHGRTDLKKRSSGWPTPCFDLADVEQALLLMWPRKGKNIIAEFKKKWGVK